MVVDPAVVACWDDAGPIVSAPACSLSEGAYAIEAKRKRAGESRHLSVKKATESWQARERRNEHAHEKKTSTNNVAIKQGEKKKR